MIPDCLNSLLMISYSKGNLKILFDINMLWGMVMMILYYVIILFFLHAAFHMIQFDALRNTVLLYGLEKSDIMDEEGKEKKKKKNTQEVDIVQLKMMQAE